MFCAIYFDADRLEELWKKIIPCLICNSERRVKNELIELKTRNDTTKSKNTNTTSINGKSLNNHVKVESLEATDPEWPEENQKENGTLPGAVPDVV